MRLSVRTSPIRSSGVSTASCRRLTSSRSADSRGRRVAERDGVPGAVQKHRDFPAPRRRRRTGLDRRTAAATHSRSVRRHPCQVLHHAVVRKDLHLNVGKRHREKRVPLARRAVVDRRARLRARAALAAR